VRIEAAANYLSQRKDLLHQVRIEAAANYLSQRKDLLHPARDDGKAGQRVWTQFRDRI
jgi:hypothetical protein